jgi:hypothetical protein
MISRTWGSNSAALRPASSWVRAIVFSFPLVNPHLLRCLHRGVDARCNARDTHDQAQVSLCKRRYLMSGVGAGAGRVRLVGTSPKTGPTLFRDQRLCRPFRSLAGAPRNARPLPRSGQPRLCASRLLDDSDVVDERAGRPPRHGVRTPVSGVLKRRDSMRPVALFCRVAVPAAASDARMVYEIGASPVLVRMALPSRRRSGRVAIQLDLFRCRHLDRNATVADLRRSAPTGSSRRSNCCRSHSC